MSARPDLGLAAPSGAYKGLATPGTQVLLIGAGEYSGRSDLPDLPSVGPTVDELRRVLINRCGVPPGNIGDPMLNPATQAEIGHAVVAKAEIATDVLLLYYCGHGLIGSDGQLHLAAGDTVSHGPSLGFTALPYDRLHDILVSCQARAVVVIIDCCFAGRAADPVPGALAALATPATAAGGYLLTAATYSEAALAPAGERYTAFGGALIALLAEGIADGPRLLTLDTLYRALDQRLSAQGRPRPHSRATGSVGGLVLAANPSYQPPGFGDALVAADAMNVQGTPYRGLAPYGETDAVFFFGRDWLIDRLRHELAVQLTIPGPLIVIGPSGAGKSSLLHAGLRPTLDNGLPGAQHVRYWPKLIVTPGTDPFISLANQLSGLLQAAPEDLRSRLDRPGGIAELAMAAVRKHSGHEDPARQRLIIIADQFEEIFGPEVDGTVRNAFLTAMADATARQIDGRDPAVLAIVGLRADSYGRALSEPFLADALARKRTFDITPMSRSELREVIVKPAEVSGFAVEPELAERILDDLQAENPVGDVGYDTQLPLLSHALLTTWRYRQGTTLTLRGYQAAGGVNGAVAHTAHQLWSGGTGRQDVPGADGAALDAEERDVARRLLLQLVYVGPEGTDAVRRRVPLPELADALGTDPADPEQAQMVSRVLGKLVSARLITVDRERAEIIHDALLRTWPQLKEWIEADRVNLAIGRQIAEAAHEWDRLGRHRGDLYTGSRLSIARQWQASVVQTPDLIADFLQLSDRAARRRRRGGFAGITAIGVALVVIAALLVVSVSDAGSLRTQNARLESQQLAHIANTLSNDDPELARDFALSAYHLADTDDADQALANASLNPAATELRVGADAFSTAFSPIGTLLATSSLIGSAGDEVSLWGNASTAHPTRVATLRMKAPCFLTFVPTTPTLAVDCNGVTTLWNTTHPANPIRTAMFGTPGQPTESVAASPDGQWLATGTTTGLMQLWRLSTGTKASLFQSAQLPAADVLSVSFRSDSKALGVGTNHEGAFVTDLTKPSPLTSFAALPGTSGNTFSVAAFSPQGNLLAVGGASLTLWNTSRLMLPAKVQVPDGLGTSLSLIRSISFTPDTHTITLGLGDGGIMVGALAPRVIADVSDAYTLPSDPETNQVTVSPDGRYVAGASEDGIVRVWSLAQHPVGHVSNIDEEVGNVSPDGKIAALRVQDSGVTGPLAYVTQIWDISHSINPVLDAVLPAQWIDAAFIGHSRTLMTINPDSTMVQLWNLADPRSPVAVGRPLTGQDPGEQIVAAANPQGSLLAINDGSNDVVTVWNISHPADAIKWNTLTSTQLTGTVAQNATPAFISDSMLIVLNGSDTQLLRWDVHRQTAPISLPSIIPSADNHIVTTIAGCQSEIFTAAHGSQAQAWDVENPYAAASGKRLGEAVTLNGSSVIGNNNNCRFADATNGGVTNDIQVWDARNLQSPRLVATIPTSGAVKDIEVSDDGTRIAAIVTPSTSPLTQEDVLDVWRLNSKAGYSQLAAVQVGQLNENAEFIPRSRLILFNPATTNAVIPDVLNTDPAANYQAMCASSQNVLSRSVWAANVPADIPYKQPC